MDADNNKSSSYAGLSWMVLVVMIVVLVYFFTQNIKMAGELERAQMKQAQKPAMPITVSMREAMLGSGLVAQLSNHSDRFIGLLITLTNPTTTHTKTIRLDIDAYGMRELGHLEGWIFVSGDQILIQHNDYRSTLVTVQ